MIRKEMVLALCLISAFFGGCVSEDHSNATASILSCEKLPSDYYLDQNYEIEYQVKNNGDKTLHGIEVHITSTNKWDPSDGWSDSVEILAPYGTINKTVIASVGISRKTLNKKDLVISVVS